MSIRSQGMAQRFRRWPSALAAAGLWGAAAVAPVMATPLARPPDGDFVVNKVVAWPPDPLPTSLQPDWAWLDRILRVQPESLVFDTEVCLEPRWQSTRVTWGQLMAESFPAVANLMVNEPARRPVDMGVRAAPSSEAVVWRTTCKGEDGSTEHAGAAWLRPKVDAWPERSGRYQPGPETWWARAPNGTWLMRDGDRLLFLQTTNLRQAPRPSFSCTKKPLDALAQTICADHDLANWDRSAVSAWKQGFKTRKRFLAFMKDEHERWLQERQGCMDREHQTPKACLLEQFQAATAYNRGN